MLGILALDTAFPRVRGDVGNPATFAFPVKQAVVRGATVERVVPGDAVLVEAFVAAGRDLALAGCHGIVTTCGRAGRRARRIGRKPARGLESRLVVTTPPGELE